jgi:hypothetical protein
MTNLLRILFSLPIVVLLVGIIFVNIRIGYPPQVETIGSKVMSDDLLKELRGLKLALQKDADIDMQKVYPEGYLFINALYGLAWCNFLEINKNKHDTYFNEGHVEIQQSWDKINSEVGRSSFNENLPLPYGAFYTGWNTYLLGKKLGIEPVKDRNANEVNLFQQQCELINSAISKNIFPSSYNGGAWPADAVVCIAVLSLHDRLFEVKYGGAIKAWLNEVKTKLDNHGLIPHSVNPLNNEPTETARGSSQSLMLIFLKDIDAEFAHLQFRVFKSNFLDRNVGLTGIREYPKDDYGIGDIDSGPVIFGLGAAATIVGKQTLNLYGEQGSASEIHNMIEAFGFPCQNNESKTYLFGLLPMADAFIAWGHSTMNIKSSEANFTTFHIYSLILVLILGLMLWFLFKRKKHN